MLTEMTKDEFNIQMGVDWEYVEGSDFYSCGKFFIQFCEISPRSNFDMKYAATIWGPGEQGFKKVASLESDCAGRLLMAADKFCGEASEKNLQWRAVAVIGWALAGAFLGGLMFAIFS